MLALKEFCRLPGLERPFNGLGRRPGQAGFLDHPSKVRCHIEIEWRRAVTGQYGVDQHHVTEAVGIGDGRNSVRPVAVSKHGIIRQ